MNTINSDVKPTISGGNLALVTQERIQELKLVEGALRVLRTGCAAALIDWQMQRLVADGVGQPRPGSEAFLRGCVAAYDQVIPLMQKILDGTVVDDDFDEAEYNAMLAANGTSFEAMKAAHDAENERLRAMWKQMREEKAAAALPSRAHEPST